MLWFILLCGSVVLGILSLWRMKLTRKIVTDRVNGETKYYQEVEATCVGWCVTGVLCALIFVVSVIAFGVGTGNAISYANFIEYSEPRLEARKQVRDQYLEILENELSEEDFIRISNAVTPDEIRYLGEIPDVSEFLLEKASRYVEANKLYWQLYGQILRKEQHLCSNMNNPFIPVFPFIDYGCDLD